MSQKKPFKQVLSEVIRRSKSKREKKIKKQRGQIASPSDIYLELREELSTKNIETINAIESYKAYSSNCWN